MRDIGYSLETAVADLIDNSISASADAVDIVCDATGDSPAVVILDNGTGMDEAELLAAMRHGAENPKCERAPHDLGRFGLGLKTASFSQCRSLTVVSAKGGVVSAAEWDLDRIDEADEWILTVLDPEDIQTLPHVQLLGSCGTAVIWRKLDRLTEEEAGDRKQEIVDEKLESLGRHLSLVFHRFLAGEVKGRAKLTLKINGRPIVAFDPYCRRNRGTQVLPEEVVRIGDAEVRLQPYILPHHSRLSATEYDHYQDRSDFISNQGGYVYRNGRLMAWGDWFRLVPKGEATKLARVQIDFPNSLDEAWTIDIKKSRARPPHVVRERLGQIISTITARSVRVHRGRGQKLFEETEAPFWERYASREGIRFAVNDRHPLVEALKSRLPAEDADMLTMLLDSISASLPTEMIYSDFSTSPRKVKQTLPDESLVLERLYKIRALFCGSGLNDANTFREIIRSTHLFDDHLELAENYVREAFP